MPEEESYVDSAQVRLEDLRLSAPDGIDFDIFSDPSFQLQFPTSPGPAQGGLMVNYLHYQLPTPTGIR